jgi:pimeloyl-ACP methyl ester carboxylesterase
MAITVTFLVGCHPAREYQAAKLLLEIAEGPRKGAAERGAGAVRSIQTFVVNGISYGADLYLSPEKPLAALLLLPGAAETGKDDPRLQALAMSLARARFAVLVPDLPGFRSLRVGSRDIGDVVRCFYWLSSRHELAPEGRAGLCGISYACGPAVLAALDPLIADRVRFIMSVGGYHDLVQVLTFFTTGYFRQDGMWRYRAPNHYGMWVFASSNMDRLHAATDRRLFAGIAARKLEDEQAPITDLARGLTAEGRSFLAFLMNRDPDRVRYLIDRLPLPIRTEIDRLNIARHDLRRLKARLIILHGYDDDIIPYTESVALAKQLPSGQGHLYLINGLMHVNLKPTLLDGYRLWRALSLLLDERDTFH